MFVDEDAMGFTNPHCCVELFGSLLMDLGWQLYILSIFSDKGPSPFIVEQGSGLGHTKHQRSALPEFFVTEQTGSLLFRPLTDEAGAYTMDIPRQPWSP